MSFSVAIPQGKGTQLVEMVLRHLTDPSLWHLPLRRFPSAFPEKATPSSLRSLTPVGDLHKSLLNVFRNLRDSPMTTLN